MNKLKAKLRVRLIEVPNLKKVDFVGLPTADFAATKSSVNLQRQKLGRLLASKNIAQIEVARQLGVEVSTLKKFIKSSSIKSIDANVIASKIVSVIDNNDIPKAPKKAKKEVIINATEFKGSEKDRIRNLYISYLIKYGIKKTGKFFSLPSRECLFELQLNTEMDNDFKYEVVEFNEKFPNIYNEMLNTIVSKNIKTHSISNCLSNEVILNRTSDTYSHIFADWCSTFTTLEREVRHIIYNNLVEVGGLVGFTFSLRDEKGKDFAKTLSNNPNIAKFGLNIEPYTKDGIYLKFLAMCYDSYEILEFEPYHDTSAMLFVLIKRIR